MTSFITSFEEIGREEGLRELVLRQLTRKIGPLDAKLHQRVSALKPPVLLDLGDALLEFSSTADLLVWLKELHAQQEYERRYGLGWSDGCRDERRRIAQRLARQRVGELKPELLTRINALGPLTLLDLLDGLMKIHSEHDLSVWLDKVANPTA